MTRRRRTVLAIAATAAVLVIAGLGARQGDLDESSDERCGEDGMFPEYCADQCSNVRDEFADACYAECVTLLCPNLQPHPPEDPIWSAPCDDMRGVPFWRKTGLAHGRCEHQFQWVVTDRSAFNECWQAGAEQLCPELAGTDWLDEYWEALGVERP